MKKILVIIIIIFVVIIGRLFYLNIYMHEYYEELLYAKTNLYVYGSSAKRGRILDVNGNVIVDNIGVNTVYYNKLSSITTDEEINIAYSLAKHLDIKEENEDILKAFYLLLNNNGEDLITSKEYQLLSERKLTSEDVLSLKYERIDLQSLSDEDKEAASIFYLMNKDYEYDKKLIASDVADEIVAIISETNILGVTTEINWSRSYPYEESLRSILGSIGPIYEEDKEYYENLGYDLSDTVGVSYLEKEYEEYLRGEKAIYSVNENGTLKLIKEEVAGNDLYLSIDMSVQLKLDETLRYELKTSKDYPNTEYFTDLYAGVSDPLTGNIIAISGQRYYSNTYEEITNEILTSSFTIGSVVKGATISVGYNYDLIDENEYIYDSCVKLEFVPEKCSWKRLGNLNDITALEKSSNYYQYLLAIKLTGKDYMYNMNLGVSDKEFDIYRDTLASFGLGNITEIDLPGETSGNKGVTVADDLLLNLTIGQYDTYTLLGMIQYINSFATKSRIDLSLLNEVRSNNELIYYKENKVLNYLDIEDNDFDRIISGLNSVMKSGTGYAYIDNKYNPIGKTGTGESFLDTDKDGKIDLNTITTSFVGLAPYNNPKYSIAVIAPHIAYLEEDEEYIYRVTRYVSSEITTFLFENSLKE